MNCISIYFNEDNSFKLWTIWDRAQSWNKFNSELGVPLYIMICFKGSLINFPFYFAAVSLLIMQFLICSGITIYWKSSIFVFLTQESCSYFLTEMIRKWVLLNQRMMASFGISRGIPWVTSFVLDPTITPQSSGPEIVLGTKWETSIISTHCQQESLLMILWT